MVNGGLAGDGQLGCGGSSLQEGKMNGTEGEPARVRAGEQGRCFPGMRVLSTSKWKVTDADLEAAADSGNKWDKYWHEKKTS